MSATFIMIQNEKSDRLQLENNCYTLIQADGSPVNAISLLTGLKKQGLKVLKVNSVNLPSKTRIRGGRNKISVKRPKKFLVKLVKGDVIKSDNIITI